MPSIKDNNVIRAIAREYISNGLNKEEAMVKAGYSPSYARSGHCARIYENKAVIEAIEAYEADLRVDASMTVGKVQDMYKEAYDMAVTTKQASSMVSAVTGIARLYGMDKDASLDKQEAEALTPDELETLRKQAESLTKPNIKLNTA